MGAATVKIVAGDHRLSRDDGTEQERDVTEIRQHESYFGSSNDVCMLYLAEPLEFNDAVSAVAMPSQDYEFEVGSQATLSGWGALGSSSSSLDGASACYGDSGGPLVCEDDRKLCGVVSWGYDCNTNVTPAVYAQAAHYVDWFTDNAA